ncbi:conserved protein of unknown function [Tenacibaculum sp. 190130A14a]|uniref:YARHG domain-containing protein n=1 Tax=Tenacibaculum polynesiense TaxID=3137857 RepID=A0ABM9PFA3_9FLAO
MRKNIWFFVLMISINGWTQFKQIDVSEIDQNKKNAIFEFAKNTINVCNDGTYVKLDANTAEKQLLNWYTISKLNKNCTWYQERYGSVIEIELAQVLKDRNNNLVFRYKIFRTLADVPQECRVYLSFRGKYYGYATKIYWDDNFYRGNKGPELFIQSLTDISDKRKNELKQFAFESYNICKLDSMPLITKENTEYRSFRKGWIPIMLKECDSIKLKNGAINSLQLEQYLSDNVLGRVYRFKAQFDKLSKPSEIRIYASLKDKYRGIFVIDKWYSNYMEFKEAVKRSEEDLN